MKKIKLNPKERLIGTSLTREQLKLIVGGSNTRPCHGKTKGSPCTWNGKIGTCQYLPLSFGKLSCLC